MAILRNFPCLALAIFLAFPLAAQSNSSVAEKLKSAPANVPVKILEEATGARLSPGFFWSPGLKKFVYFAGLAASRKPHYDVEHFDLSTGKWTNAYPGGSPYKGLSGSTDAPSHSATRGGIFSLVDKQGVSRIPLVGNYYGRTAVLMARQYALDPSSGLLYALVLNKLTVLDTKKSTWAFAASKEKKANFDLKNPSAWQIYGFEGFSKGGVMHWGAFCFDPVNKEILSIGGSGMSKGGTPGTWVFSLSKKKWTRVKTDTAPLTKIREKLEKLRDRSWALLSHARSRFFITESPEEEKQSLSKISATLQQDLKAYQKELKTAKVPKELEAGRSYTLGKIKSFLSEASKLKRKLDAKLNPEFLLLLRDTHRLLESAVFGLHQEPSGRAFSQTVWDPVNKKIVLFGGEGLDRSLGDTWVYDVKTRTWEQRFPEKAPSPVAAHTLAWLPKAKKVVLIGGYSKDKARPFEIWTYQVAANKWTLLKQIQIKRGNSIPTNFQNLGVVGAVGPDDVVLLVQRSVEKRNTWAVKIDARKKSSVSAGVEASSMRFSKEGKDYYRETDSSWHSSSHKGSAYYEKKAKIEATKMKAFFKNLPLNTLKAFPTPMVAAPSRDYGTTRYDPHRKQFLYWGGGHVNYWGTEVNHYSLRSACWTAGEVPDEPLEPTFGMCPKIGMSFRNRPQVGSHAYQWYEYDYTSGLLLVAKYGRTYIYDVAKRTWQWPLLDGDAAGGKEGVSGGMRATPKGIIGTRSNAKTGKVELVLFNAKKRKWIKLPIKSGKVPIINRDYGGFTYDTKRDCLWFFGGGVFHYDLKTGVASQKLKSTFKPGLLREVMYIPEIDRVMFLTRKNKAHNFWNPEKLIWETAEFPAQNFDGSPVAKALVFETSGAIMYDHLSKIVLISFRKHYNAAFYALKLKPETIKFTEVK